MAERDNPIVGIDLGTTFSAVAAVDGSGTPSVLDSRDGTYRTVPSVVFFDPAGIQVVGAQALNVAVSEPERVVQFVKREMGNPNYVRTFDGQEWTAEGISGCILRHLKNLAEERLDTEVSRAVISVPAYFMDAAKTATKAAGETAGLDVVALINEPTAAAIAYGLGKVGEKQTIVVYDFGGGTFDVTVLRIEGSEFTVLATDGDARLGGFNINERIVDHLAESMLDRHGVDLRSDPQSNGALWSQAEQAKLTLTARQSIMIPLTWEQASMRVDLDRDQFNELIADLVDRTREKMEAALASSGLSWPGIDAVLPVGGSSRIPAVRDMIEQVTGQRPAAGIKADEIVACGAALRACLTDVTESSTPGPAGPGALTSGAPPSAATGIVVRDVAPHSVGVRASDDQGRDINSIIIPRLTEVPCERIRTYSTVADGQSKIELFILQGEDPDPFSPDVEPIGRVAVTDLPLKPAGQVLVSVALRYDANGMIEVEAKELAGGAVVRGQLMKKVGELDPELLEAMRLQVVKVDEDIPAPFEPTPTDEPSLPPALAPEATIESPMDGGKGSPADEPPFDPPMDYDYYDYLEVAPGADAATIEAALKAFEEQWSAEEGPGRTGDPEVAESVRRRLAAARYLLLDSDRRAAYDARFLGDGEGEV